MAGCAVPGRGLVEQHCFGLYCPRHFVTVLAAHILMRAPQRECRSLIVIKQRRSPSGAVVTLLTMGHIRLGELLAVDVLMAVPALGWRSLEIDVDQLRFKIRRFVAIDAGGDPMRAEQGKLRLGVIESRNFLPGFRCMARFASRGRTVGARLLHACCELPLVRIAMATGAVQMFPVIDHRSFGL